MGWGDDARDATIAKFEAGTSEKEIVKVRKARFHCDDKTLRRCLAGLRLLRARVTQVSDAKEKGQGVQEMVATFEAVGGTDHYLRELDRAVAASQRPPEPPSFLLSKPVVPDRHIDELLTFGILLRDCLQSPSPQDLADRSGEKAPRSPWRGISLSLEATDLEEQAERLKWRAGARYDARAHPLFASFHEHVVSEHVWDALAKTERAFEACFQASKRLASSAYPRAAALLPTLSKPELEAARNSVVTSSTFPQGGPEFSYDVAKESDGGRDLWRLAVGGWSVVRDSSEELTPIAGAHRRLVMESTELGRVGGSHQSAARSRVAGEGLPRDPQPGWPPPQAGPRRPLPGLLGFAVGGDPPILRQRASSPGTTLGFARTVVIDGEGSSRAGLRCPPATSLHAPAECGANSPPAPPGVPKTQGPCPRPATTHVGTIHQGKRTQIRSSCVSDGSLMEGRGQGVISYRDHRSHGGRRTSTWAHHRRVCNAASLPSRPMSPTAQAPAPMAATS